MTEKPGFEDFEWRSRMIGVFRDQLPHWVAEHGCYAVTLRCRGSLPKPVLQKLREQVSAQVDINGSDSDYRLEQRRLFLSLEHYLDQGLGFAPFHDRELALKFSRWLSEYNQEGMRFSCWTVMPNHLHLITKPLRSRSCEEFGRKWVLFKMRSTRFLNLSLQRRGAFWQRSWFDRWIRDASELQKWMVYLEQNPVKADLSTEPEKWPGSSSYLT
ncbi:MAG TPA: hypothetical protein VJ952_02960 [Opitutales bacterium]|nr:hypothetical protein [Opitutales bacterium]